VHGIIFSYSNISTTKETTMSASVEKTPAQETVAGWKDEDLLVFVPAESKCRYKAIIYPTGSILRIGAVLFVDEESVHCQAAGPDSIGTGPEDHTIRTIDPLDEKCRLLERSNDRIAYGLPGQEPEMYRLHEGGLAKVKRKNKIIVDVSLA
jgi:hypothetical protein